MGQLSLLDRIDELMRDRQGDAPEPERVLSVGELNSYVQKYLADNPTLQGLKLRGEISNFKRHSSGHLYFTMKDDAARISCVMFKAQAQQCRARLADGQRFVAAGKVSLFPRDGLYQFYVDSMKLDGVGELYLRYEELRGKLQAEGLFDSSLKRPLPRLPRGVGIVTSATGAVLQDIRNVAARRHPGIPLCLVPVRVQGEGAAEEIARAIRQLDRLDYIDVIIIGRGGGSLEDLWPFNEEIVVRAVAACGRPIVSAVGHETDITLSDFAADVRAPTPSAAAELVIPILDNLLEQVDSYRERLYYQASRQLAYSYDRLASLKSRLLSLEPRRALAERRRQVDELRDRLTINAGRLVPQRRILIANMLARLDALNPDNVLTRGYAMLTDPTGRCVTSAADARIGQTIHINMRDGSIDANIMNIKTNEVA